MAILAVLAFSLLQRGSCQACSSRCPPLDEVGNEVPSLCPGDDVSGELAGVSLPVCHPSGTANVELPTYMSTQAPAGPAYILVISNYYIGCNAGRREANVYSYASASINERYPNVIFLSSLKGGSSGQCQTWANIFERDGAIALGSFSDSGQPLTIHDGESQVRDAFFTAPYPHPSYVIIDHNGQMRHKLVGPCCGRANYFDCSTDTAMALNTTLYEKLMPLLDEVAALYNGTADCFFSDWTEWSACGCESTNSGTRTHSRRLLQKAIGSGSCGSESESEACQCSNPVDCVVGEWEDWSSCSRYCGTGERHRSRAIVTQPEFDGASCPSLSELGSCVHTPCEQQCIPVLGKLVNVTSLASSIDGLSSPRALAFNPLPGRHLGNFSEGRKFPTMGPEAWVANGHGQAITIVAALGSTEQETLTRMDRGWFHYMMNITAISFNAVNNSGRSADKDTLGYFATCQDNNNTYSGSKDPNFFMGPSLYDSAPTYKNLVRHDGGECTPADECFFLHADMLHESPACPGIVHDPEHVTAYGSVYWAIDTVAGHVVRYDFQQPHGPGLMDHSVAAVRRYPEVQVERGRPGLHHGMVIDAEARFLYISAAGSGKILKVNIDSGEYFRDARAEYPVFSSRLPSFEYSIWGCVEQEIFATGLQEPSGLALRAGQLFVAEFGTGNLVVYDVATGFLMQNYSASRPGLMGLAFSDESRLFGVNAETSELLEFKPEEPCDGPDSPYANVNYVRPASLTEASNNSHCNPNTSIPDADLFVQVHTSTGYASNDSSVQNDSTMDSNAALLENRSDCDPNSSLNFDALLLGGWHCHRCLPDNCALRDGGKCVAIQWDGYTCDNEVRLSLSPGRDGSSASDYVLNSPNGLRLVPNRTYRLVVNTKGAPVYTARGGSAVTASLDVGMLRIPMLEPFPDALMGAPGVIMPIYVDETTTSTTTSTATTVSMTSTITSSVSSSTASHTSTSRSTTYSTTGTDTKTVTRTSSTIFTVTTSSSMHTKTTTRISLTATSITGSTTSSITDSETTTTTTTSSLTSSITASQTTTDSTASSTAVSQTTTGSTASSTTASQSTTTGSTTSSITASHTTTGSPASSTSASQTTTGSTASSTTASQSTTTGSTTSSITAQRIFTAAVAIEVVLAGDYDTVVGDDKTLFLQECSDKLNPVSCVDVRPGSIIVVLSGTGSTPEQANAAVSSAKNDIQTNGLVLTGFGSLMVQDSLGASHTTAGSTASSATASQTNTGSTASSTTASQSTTTGSTASFTEDIDMMSPSMSSRASMVMASIFFGAYAWGVP